MVRNLKIAGVLVMIVIILMAIAFFFGRYWQKDLEIFEKSPAQQTEALFQNSGLTLAVETDKQIYSYDDIIYVTARLINNTDKTVTVNLPEGAGYHREIVTEFSHNANASAALYDIDFYYYILYPRKKPEKEQQTIVLEPGECYTQNMRFSTNCFLDPNHHYPVNLITGAPSGTYTGIFQAFVRTKDGADVPFTAQISVTIQENSP